jgi:hypothetical protein
MPVLRSHNLLRIAIGVALAACGSSGDTATDVADSPAAWFMTCGDPVCQSYTGPFDGVPLCTDEGVSQTDPCDSADIDTTCDPVDGCNALLVCAVSDPTMQTGGCPISLASNKEQIHYLSVAERQESSDALMAMKLATWRYTPIHGDPSTHLGFVIDDVPGSPAVRPDGEHVDLYGYTSLAVAAIQQQQAQIDTLAREIDMLKQACGE